MCTNYTPATPRQLLTLPELAGVALPEQPWPAETFPGYRAPIVLRGSEGVTVCELASYGLVPRWCKDAGQASAVSRRTYNARAETVGEKPSYRAPWRERQFALAPMRNYFEPCWESGRAVRWRIRRLDEAAFAVAGIHERWTDRATGEVVRSFSLLTVNADGHALLGRMHRPDDEKRMLVVVPPAAYGQWLGASLEEAQQMMQRMPAEGWVAEPAPRVVERQQSLGF